MNNSQGSKRVKQGKSNILFRVVVKGIVLTKLLADVFKSNFNKGPLYLSSIEALLMESLKESVQVCGACN